MLRATKRLIIASEGVNKYGFRALVAGIDLKQYERNPIMLWMHHRPFGGRKDEVLPLGNVVELKTENIDGIGICLTGLPIFDDSDEFAVKIYNKYENGTLRMASVALIPVDWSVEQSYIVQGQMGATLVKSILEEVSIVDIGADNNAVNNIVLYNENHERIELNAKTATAVIPQLQFINSKADMEKIELTAAKAAAILGAEVQNADQFERKIMEVVQLAAAQKTQIETLTRDKSALEQKITDNEKLQLAAKVENLVQGAVDARKITADEKPHYVELASANYEAVEKILGAKGSAPTLQSQIAGAGAGSVNLYAGKSYAELDKSGLLVQLKADNLPLFKELFKAQYGVDYKG